MADMIEIINKDIKSLLYNIDYDTFYIDNGLFLKFKSGDIKIKYDSSFGWVSYIEDYDSEYENEIDIIYEIISEYIINCNEKLCS